MEKSVQTTLFNMPSEKDRKKFVDECMELFNALRRPKIVMPMHENAEIPVDIRNRIFVERILLAKDGEKIASESETLWYLSTVSMSVHFGYSWYRIFTFLFRRWCVNSKKEIPDFAGEEIVLDDCEQIALKRLREWLYKKSIEALK